MRTLQVKCEFPFNWYSLRSLKLKDDKGSVYRISPGQRRSFEIEACAVRLKARLDYLSAGVDLPDTPENVYAIIYMKLPAGAFGAFIGALKPSALQFKLVSADEFERFSTDFYHESLRKSKGIGSVDGLSYLTLLALAAWMVILGVVKDYWGDFSNLLFATEVLSIVSLAVLWFDKKNIGVKSYRIRQVTLGVVAFGMLLYASKLGYQHAWWLILLPLIAVLRTITVKFNPPTSLVTPEK